MLLSLENGRIYISKGTPMPYLCPKCDNIIPVASLNGIHPGVDRNSSTVLCTCCKYLGDVEEFDVEWEFKPAN